MFQMLNFFEALKKCLLLAEKISPTYLDLLGLNLLFCIIIQNQSAFVAIMEYYKSKTRFCVVLLKNKMHEKYD
jgi:hypothetical protein